jgi:hypothetical protein
MTGNASFSDALDWIAMREGDRVYIEIGVTDPTLDDADFYPIKLHATLGTLQVELIARVQS